MVYYHPGLAVKQAPITNAIGVTIPLLDYGFARHKFDSTVDTSVTLQMVCRPQKP